MKLPGPDCFAHGLVRCAIGATCAVALSSLPDPARADYRYEYTSNPFPVTWSPLFDPEQLQPFTVDTILTATVLSPTRLAGGAAFTNGMSFSLTQSAPGFVTETLTYPYPYTTDPTCGPGCPGNPINDGIFNIGAVDARRLPTQWNMSINYSYRAPTGREYSRDFASSDSLDSISGGYEGFQSIAGSITGNPGGWTVTPVPEPGTWAMLLAGLGVIVVAARRRQHSAFNNMAGSGQI